MSCSSWLQFVAHRQFTLTLLWYLVRGDEGGKQSSHHVYRTCQPKFIDNDGREQGYRLESNGMEQGHRLESNGTEQGHRLESNSME